MKDIFSVQDRKVVVTGGASGIGLAIAEALAERGASVTIMDRDTARLDAVVKRMTDAGYKARGQIFDASSPQSVKESFEQAAKFHGGLDVVFANAGIGGKSGGFVGRDGKPNVPGEIINFEFDSWKETLGVNLDGPFLTIKEAARHMKPQMRGHIVVTSSFMPLVTLNNVDLAYSVSKAAVTYLMRVAALELARYNIQVNAICPGMFATGISGGRLSDPAVMNTVGPLVPLGRVAVPEEMKGLAVFLASSASSYCTGSQMLIDGGLSLGRVNYRDSATQPPSFT